MYDTIFCFNFNLLKLQLQSFPYFYSYIKLQEEKERMFEEHRKAIEKLKEQNDASEKVS